MGEKVTDLMGSLNFEIGQNFKNRGHLQKTSDFVDDILIFCPRLCACVPIRTCTCLRLSVCVRYIRTLTSQQHKYSGYFNICSFCQKKYVVSEWNLRSRKNSKQIIFKCLCDTRLFLFQFLFTNLAVLFVSRYVLAEPTQIVLYSGLPRMNLRFSPLSLLSLTKLGSLG